MGTRTKLDRLLFERHIRQVDLSASSGVARQTLSNAIQGRPVSTETWIRLANALNVSIAEIAPPEEAAKVTAVA